jgi:hypothetical protein
VHARAEAAPPRLAFPTPAARFVLDGNLHDEQQQIVLTARASASEQLVFELDGAVVCRVGVPFQCPWRLRRGAHNVRVFSERGSSEQVSFRVE